MDKHAAPFPGGAEHSELTHMLGLDGVAIALRLDQPALAIDDDFAIDPAVPGIATIADHAVPAPLEGLQQQFLERQRVHRAKPCIMQRGGLVAIASA